MKAPRPSGFWLIPESEDAAFEEIVTEASDAGKIDGRPLVTGQHAEVNPRPKPLQFLVVDARSPVTRLPAAWASRSA